MKVIQSLILGILQGLTEFLPVSSSGHLVLMQTIFGIDEGGLFFNVAVHLATLVPVFIIFWKDILAVIKKPLGKMTWLIIAGTIPTAIIALLFKDFFESAFKTGNTLGIGFYITGVILWYADKTHKQTKKLETTSYKDSAFVGLMQGIAIIPAVSRSGSTIAGALFRGLDREFALKLSFMLSIPAILAATAKESIDLISAGTTASPVPIQVLLVGMIAAALSGYVAIKILIKVLLKGSLRNFSYYVWILGTFVFLDQIFFKVFF